MNIFVLDNDPAIAATYHNDKHVVKMILEYSALLATAHFYLDGAMKAKAKLHTEFLQIMPTHENHPCSKWVRESSRNYDWLWNLLHGVCDEYTLRYGKNHAYDRSGLVANLAGPPLGIPITADVTDRPQCMPAQFRRADAVDAYRAYYVGEKQHIACWKNGMPKWFKEMSRGVVAA